MRKWTWETRVVRLTVPVYEFNGPCRTNRSSSGGSLSRTQIIRITDAKLRRRPPRAPRRANTNTKQKRHALKPPLR